MKRGMHEDTCTRMTALHATSPACTLQTHASAPRSQQARWPLHVGSRLKMLKDRGLLFRSIALNI